MGFPDSGRTEENDVFTSVNESKCRQLLNQLFVDRRLKGKIKSLDGLDVWKAGEAHQRLGRSLFGGLGLLR